MSYYDPDDLFDDYYADDTNGLIVQGKQKAGPNGPVETAKAILWITLDGKEHWIPRTQIYAMEADCIHITDWLADKKEWDETVNIAPAPKLEKNYDIDDDIPF